MREIQFYFECCIEIRRQKKMKVNMHLNHEQKASNTGGDGIMPLEGWGTENGFKINKI